MNKTTATSTKPNPNKKQTNKTKQKPYVNDDINKQHKKKTDKQTNNDNNKNPSYPDLTLRNNSHVLISLPFGLSLVS